MIEFWDNISRDERKITKLEELIYNININLESISLVWKELQKLKLNDTKLLLVYEKFLKNALNDENGGEELRNYQNQNEEMQNKDSILGEYTQYLQDGSAYIIININRVF